jgi:hypothetical protein
MTPKPPSNLSILLVQCARLRVRSQLGHRAAVRWQSASAVSCAPRSAVAAGKDPSNRGVRSYH